MAAWSEATAPSCYDRTFAVAFHPLYIGPYGGCTGGHVAVREVMWWESWRVHGGAYWGYRGTHGSTGVSMVGALGTRGGTGEQYGGSIEGRLTVLGCPLDPLNNSGGVLGHPPAP